MAKAKTKSRSKTTGGKTKRKKAGRAPVGRSGGSTARASGNGRTADRITGREIEDFIAKLTGLKPDVAHELWRQIIAQIRQSLVEGKAVNITSVGTLEPYLKVGTTYRHPITQKLRTTEDRTHVRFTLSTGLKADLNKSKPKKKAKKKAAKK